MSDDKDAERSFLSRWSQRKREAKLPNAEVASPQADQETSVPPAIADSDADEPFDLSSLPNLEELNETTDITGFLRKGVPESLRNAALRKSWALDPAIRNYVNPALDYAYDWNTPGGVPGNSELAVGTDIAKLVLQIMGNDAAVDPPAPHEPAAAPLHQIDASGESADVPGIAALQKPEVELNGLQLRLTQSDTHPLNDFAYPVTATDELAHDAPPVEARALQQPARRHGSAKPRV